MCRQFHVAPSTVTAAYAALQRTGHVTRIGKNYWLGQPGVLLRSGKRREIAVFVETHEQLASLYHPQTFASVAFRKLEDILSTSGYTVRYRYHPQLHERVKLWLERRDLPAGVVLYRCDGHQARRHQALRDLVRQRRPFPPLPVLLDLNWGLFEHRSKNVSVFSRNHVYTTVGRTLGTYLRRMGCRTLSLVLPNELSSAYPGYPTHFQAATKLFIEIKHVIPEIEVTTALVDDSPDADIAPDKLSRQCKLARFDKYGALLPGAFTGRMALRGSVREAVRTRGGADVMVFSHDSLAAEALEVCRTQRIPVPRQLAIIGLENNPAYFHLGMSSCVPDWDGIGYLMAHALMQDFAIENTGKGFIQTRAKMIYRTTAVA
ncbi:MAG: hypothetical protein GF331_23220 [Chitinivibrionales bacterium]|nr:hypothetical protein [Chitinivibrionales bacterium]